MRKSLLIILSAIFFLNIQTYADSTATSLWKAYLEIFKDAKYIDLTHSFEPVQAVWSGFGNAKFYPALAGSTIEGYINKGEEFTYEKHGFAATAYELPTDQYGTQLDPPSHWNNYGATISDIPPTYALRPLVVIDIHEKVALNTGYHLQIDDILSWESKYGIIPEGSVVMVRSDWYKKWADIGQFNRKPFPGVSLAALKFLHAERKILFHGHEPLDTDTTGNLEGEYWLMHNNYAQAEGVANLDLVPETGALINIGFAKPQGGTGGYARYVAIAPMDWPHGVSVREIPGAPLAEQAYPLVRDKNGVMRPTPKPNSTVKEHTKLFPFELEQNYPNPFNPVTKINYSVPKQSHVRINIFNDLGREVAALVNSEKPAGNYSLEFNASLLPSGIYYYQLKTDEFKQTKKMILLR